MQFIGKIQNDSPVDCAMPLLAVSYEDVSLENFAACEKAQLAGKT